jgi:cobalt-precorrin 5A hydrolase
MKPFTIVSLTDEGAGLARRILALHPQARHLHRPKPFGDTVRARFRAGHRLIMITATGIAVRTLAPALGDKHRDPAVLVLDQEGRFVIPLLSGHEGGANEWARTLAGQLGASCVITSAGTYTRPIHVVGMGCERGCPVDHLRELFQRGLRLAGIEAAQVRGLASIELKSHEPGLLALGGELGLTPVFFSAAALTPFENRLSTRSEIVFRETGVHGVAESAALALAEALGGPEAELVVKKIKGRRATFALARSYAPDTYCHGDEPSFSP